MRRTVLITGATSGLGRALAVALARQGDWRILVHGRDARRCSALVEQLTSSGTEATGFVADFDSLREASRLGREVASYTERLDLLVNNAGVGAGRRDGGRELSADGYERRLAVNYLAPVALTHELEGVLAAAARRAQVLNIGSVGMDPVDFDDPHMARSYGGMTAYTRSKFALAAFSFTAAQDWAGRVNVNCIHPATYMDTAMVRESGVSPWTSVDVGCQAVCRAITEGWRNTSVFYDGARPSRGHRLAYDETIQRRLAVLAESLIKPALS